MKASDKALFVIGLVLTFAGLDLAILLSHVSRLLGILFLIAGIGLLLWSVKGEDVFRPSKPSKPKNLAGRVAHLLTLNGRAKWLLPVAGIAIIAAVFAFNLAVKGEFYLGSNDYVALFLAGVLLMHNYIPPKYSVERDFALLFGMLLFILLVIPTTILSLGGGEADTNTPLTYYFLAMPTAGLVRLLGVPVEAPVYNSLTDTYIYNQMAFAGPDGYPINLSIALSCSGLYSVAIFVSAFVSFVAVEYRKLDRRVVTMLIAGIALAWLANVIRMAIIVLVGRHYGADTMEWVHNNIGELIFMAWIILFWMLMFRQFGLFERGGPGTGKDPEPNLARDRCPGCGGPLSPSMPALKCGCGRVSHAECVRAGGGRCPSCSAEMPDRLGKN